MKLLLITDSLGLPREQPELVQHHETWCYLLAQDFEVQQCSIGGATIDQLTSQLNYLKLFNPDIVIVQSGIVDCAPRALSKTENYLINKYWLTRKFFNRFSHRLIRILRKRGKTYTSKKKFEQQIEYVKKVFVDKVYWLSIIEGNEMYEVKVPGICKNIYDYNAILKNKMENHFIELKGLSKDFLTSDMHHLNSKGHEFVFNKIKKEIVQKRS